MNFKKISTHTSLKPVEIKTAKKVINDAVAIVLTDTFSSLIKRESSLESDGMTGGQVKGVHVSLN